MMSVNARALYLTHLLTYLYKQASSVSSIRVSVRGQGSCLYVYARAPTLNLKVSPNPKLSVYRSMW